MITFLCTQKLADLDCFTKIDKSIYSYIFMMNVVNTLLLDETPIKIIWTPQLLCLWSNFDETFQLLEDGHIFQSYEPVIRVCNQKLLFLFLNLNICCGYSKELSH